MPSFEAGGQRPQNGPDRLSSLDSELRAALAEKAQVEARYAYLGARERELLPDLQEETRLEIAEELARRRLEAAKGLRANRSARVSQKAALVEQLRQAEARARQAIGELPPSPVPTAEPDDAPSDEKNAGLQAEHDRVSALLAACRQRIQTADAALRRRYGIPETEV